MNETLNDAVTTQVVAEAVWAPSVHNTQPWRFVTGPGPRRLGLYADHDRCLTVADPDGREMLISCGAALFTARLALRALGYIPVVHLVPEPGDPLLVARLAWDQRAPLAESERRLYGQIRRRRTHRGGFDPEPLPSGLLATLRHEALREGAMLRLVADDARRATLAALVQTAELTSRNSSERLRELTRWAPAPRSMRGAGVPATSYPARPERTDPWLPQRDFAHGRGWGLPPLSTASAARSTGVIGLLTTHADRPEDWIRTGQALQRILLTASANGVAAALHSQPLEIPALRMVLRTEFSDGACPQLVLRLGRVIQVAVSVRREPADVLFPAPDQEDRGNQEDQVKEA